LFYSDTGIVIMDVKSVMARVAVRGTLAMGIKIAMASFILRFYGDAGNHYVGFNITLARVAVRESMNEANAVWVSSNH
jgi:hypothetical protein